MTPHKDRLGRRLGGAVRKWTRKAREQLRRWVGWEIGTNTEALAELGGKTPEQVGHAVEKAAEYEQDPADFYELVRRLSTSPVFRSSIRTRRHAITQIEPVVLAASESPADEMVALEVEEHVLPFARTIMPELLRASSHGLSVMEIQWNTDQTPWAPVDYQWWWPQLFRATADNSVWRRTTDSDAEELGTRIDATYGRWLDHRAENDGTTPFVAGVAASCMVWWLAKVRTRARWAAFIDTYGFPLRLGYYSDDHTDSDVEILEEILQNIGRDQGGMIPEGMKVDISNVAATRGGSSDYFRRMIEMADHQMEIEILGQTATTEGTPGRLGADATQDRVRRDIALADGRMIGRTVTDQLAEPFVSLHHGPDVPVPEIVWIVPEPPEDLNAWSQAVYRMSQRGLRIVAEDIRTRLRLTTPKDDDEIMEGEIRDTTADDPMRGTDNDEDDSNRTGS